MIKSADIGSVVAVWERDDYIEEVEKQIGNKGIYEVFNDPRPLVSTIRKTIEKIQKRDDLNPDTIKFL